MSRFTIPQERAERFRQEGYWGDVTIPGLFRQNLDRNPDAIGLVDAPNRPTFFEGAPRRLTYRQMDSEIALYANTLRAAGLGKGDIIATQLPNIAEMILIYLAISRIGAILSPISMSYRANELRGMQDIVDFAAFIAVTKFKDRPFLAPLMPALKPETKVFSLGSNCPAGATPFEWVVEQAGASEIETSADDLFAVFWTSGTEGLPKAVPKTHNNMMASSQGAYRLLSLRQGANVLAPFPFVNAAGMGGLMMCWMRSGGALVLHHPFDIEVYLEQLRTCDVDYTMMAPTLLVYVKDKSEDPDLYDALNRLSAIGTGSAPPDPEIFDYFQQHFDIPIVNFFGSNEGAQLCSSKDDVPDARLRARFFPRDGDINWAGHADRRTANGGYFKLIDPETGAAVVDNGASGEMYIDGPAQMPGYFTRQGMDRAKFDADGLFSTGDLFEISQDGKMIRFLSRSRELIVRGGMKIAPVELDAFLSGFPDVREVAVAPYRDETMGEKVCAYFAMNKGVHVTLKEVSAYCDRHGLAKFKWPEMCIQCDSLPKTPLAKIDRKALTADLAGRLGATETA